jgi:ankyrin repeat protein
MFKLFLLILFTFISSTFETPFTDAAETGDLVNLLSMLQADPNLIAQVGSADRTALMLASWKGHTEIVKLLIEAQSNVDQVDKFGYTALILASSLIQEDAVKILIGKGAEVNHANKSGDTPLIVAARWSWTNGCKILIEARANVNYKAPHWVEYESRTALNYAVEKNNSELIELLVSSGAETWSVSEHPLVKQSFEKFRRTTSFFEFSSFAKVLPDSQKSRSILVEIVDETIKNLIHKT